jgi:hypothetical protein
VATMPTWNVAQFGCLPAESVRIASRRRTELSSGLPVPMVSRKGDTSACVELGFTLEVDDAGRAAWEQWVTYDLFDGSLPFTMAIPWGATQAQIRARLAGDWQARRLAGGRWQIAAAMEIERNSLPRFSGGAYA